MNSRMKNVMITVLTQTALVLAAIFMWTDVSYLVNLGFFITWTYIFMMIFVIICFWAIVNGLIDINELNLLSRTSFEKYFEYGTVAIFIVSIIMLGNFVTATIFIVSFGITRFCLYVLAKALSERG